MVGIIIKVVIGLVLFAGSLVGGLAATGRLNHEGTANIPVLNSFFPEPPKAAGEEGAPGDPSAADATHAAPGGETNLADGSHAGSANAADASHAAQHPGTQNPGNQPTPSSRRSVTGPSNLNPVAVKADAHGGGGEAAGHGAKAEGGHGADSGHAADPHAKDSHANAGHGPGDHGPGDHKAGDHGAGKTSAERDFDKMEDTLKSQGRINYAPGAFFTFQGMPAGMTPEQVNEAWQRVQGLMQTIEQRNVALDLREAEIRELGEDISKRWKDIGVERQKVEQMQRELQAKITKFEQTVKLVRNEEIPKLKANAATLASFERKKASELLQQKWATERGRDEILRVLEFMDKDAVNEILAELPNTTVQEVLEMRMQISKEPTATGG